MEAPMDPVEAFPPPPSEDPTTLRDGTNAFLGRKMELEELHKLIQAAEKETTIPGRTTILFGLEGIGKTSLAREYVKKYHNYHQNVAWMDARTMQSLRQSFHTLAIHLKLIPGTEEKDGTNEVKDLNLNDSDAFKDLMKKVYLHFSDHVGQGMFIFDFGPVTELAIVDDILPKNLLQRMPLFLLICKEKFGSFQGLCVMDGLNYDSFEFLMNKFNLTVDILKRHSKRTALESHLKEMDKMLGGFPLALKLVSSSINGEVLKASDTHHSEEGRLDKIEKFVDNFNKKFENEFEHLNTISEVGAKMTDVWQSRLDKIKKSDEKSAGLAIRVLLVVAHKTAAVDLTIQLSLSELTHVQQQEEQEPPVKIEECLRALEFLEEFSILKRIPVTTSDLGGRSDQNSFLIKINPLVKRWLQEYFKRNPPPAWQALPNSSVSPIPSVRVRPVHPSQPTVFQRIKNLKLFKTGQLIPPEIPGPETPGPPYWFNVPKPVHPFYGRIEFMKKIEETFHSKKSKLHYPSSSPSQPMTEDALDDDKAGRVVVIIGVEGIGKSRVALNYVHGDRYQNVIWLDSSYAKHGLEYQFKKLAQQLNVTATEWSEKMETNQVVTKCYEKLCRRPTLIVFDGVSQYGTGDQSPLEHPDGIQPFMPFSLYSSAGADTLSWTPPAILITSSNTKCWMKQFRILELGALLDEEAVEFVRKELHCVEGTTEYQEAVNLCHTLQNYPLQLRLAVNFLKVENERVDGHRVTMSEYGQKISQKQKDSLDIVHHGPPSESVEDVGVSHHQVEIILETLKKNGNEHLAAIRLIHVIALLEPFLMVAPLYFLLLKSAAPELDNVSQTLKYLKPVQPYELAYQQSNLPFYPDIQPSIQRGVLKSLGHDEDINSLMDQLLTRCHQVLDQLPEKEDGHWNQREIVTAMLSFVRNADGLRMTSQGKYLEWKTRLALKFDQLDMHEQALAILRQVVQQQPDDGGGQLETNQQIVVVLMHQKKYGEALALSKQMYDKLKGLSIDNNDSALQNVLMKMAQLYQLEERYDEARETFDKCQPSSVSGSSGLHTELKLAVMQLPELKVEQVQELLDRLYEKFQERKDVKDRLLILELECKLAILYLKSSESKKATQILDTVVNDLEKIFQDKPPASLESLWELAEEFVKNEEKESGIKLLDKLYEIQKKIRGPCYRDCLETMFRIAIASKGVEYGWRASKILEGLFKHRQAIKKSLIGASTPSKLLETIQYITTMLTELGYEFSEEDQGGDPSIPKSALKYALRRITLWNDFSYNPSDAYQSWLELDSSDINHCIVNPLEIAHRLQWQKVISATNMENIRSKATRREQITTLCEYLIGTKIYQLDQIMAAVKGTGNLRLENIFKKIYRLEQYTIQHVKMKPVNTQHPPVGQIVRKTENLVTETSKLPKQLQALNEAAATGSVTDLVNIFREVTSFETVQGWVNINDGQTPLHVSASEGDSNLDFVRRFIELVDVLHDSERCESRGHMGSYPNAKCPRIQFYNRVDQNGKSALFLAAEAEAVEISRVLIQYTTSSGLFTKHMKGPKGITPLEMLYGRIPEVIEDVLDHHITSGSNDGKSATLDIQPVAWNGNEDGCQTQLLANVVLGDFQGSSKQILNHLAVKTFLDEKWSQFLGRIFLLTTFYILTHLYHTLFLIHVFVVTFPYNSTVNSTLDTDDGGHDDSGGLGGSNSNQDLDNDFYKYLLGTWKAPHDIETDMGATSWTPSLAHISFILGWFMFLGEVFEIYVTAAQTKFNTEASSTYRGRGSRLAVRRIWMTMAMIVSAILDRSSITTCIGIALLPFCVFHWVMKRDRGDSFPAIRLKDPTRRWSHNDILCWKFFHKCIRAGLSLAIFTLTLLQILNYEGQKENRQSIYSWTTWTTNVFSGFLIFIEVGQFTISSSLFVIQNFWKLTRRHLVEPIEQFRYPCRRRHRLRGDYEPGDGEAGVLLMQDRNRPPLEDNSRIYYEQINCPASMKDDDDGPNFLTNFFEGFITYLENLENILQLAYILMIMWVSASVMSGRLTNAIYVTAAFSAIFAWLLILMQIGNIHGLGSYIQILKMVVHRFLAVMGIYICILVAFSIAFTILFPIDQFESLPSAFYRVVAMMAGELNYDGIFHPENPTDSFRPFPYASQWLHTGFIITVVIILINLLIGLTVNDIQKIYDDAEVIYRAVQVERLYFMEKFMIFLNPILNCGRLVDDEYDSSGGDRIQKKWRFFNLNSRVDNFLFIKFNDLTPSLKQKLQNVYASRSLPTSEELGTDGPLIFSHQLRCHIMALVNRTKNSFRGSEKDATLQIPLHWLSCLITSFSEKDGHLDKDDSSSAVRDCLESMAKKVNFVSSHHQLASNNTILKNLKALDELKTALTMTRFRATMTKLDGSHGQTECWQRCHRILKGVLHSQMGHLVDSLEIAPLNFFKTDQSIRPSPVKHLILSDLDAIASKEYQLFPHKFDIDQAFPGVTRVSMLGLTSRLKEHQSFFLPKAIFRPGKCFQNVRRLTVLHVDRPEPNPPDHIFDQLGPLFPNLERLDVGQDWRWIPKFLPTRANNLWSVLWRTGTEAGHKKKLPLVTIEVKLPDDDSLEWYNLHGLENQAGGQFQMGHDGGNQVAVDEETKNAVLKDNKQLIVSWKGPFKTKKQLHLIVDAAKILSTAAQDTFIVEMRIPYFAPIGFQKNLKENFSPPGSFKIDYDYDEEDHD